MNKRTEKIVLFFTDFITINLAWLTFFYLRVESGLFQIVLLPEFFLPMLVIFFFWMLVFVFAGMYRTWFALSRLDELSSLFKATFVGIFVLFAAILWDDYQHNVSSANRFLIFIYWGLLYFTTAAGRLIVRSIQKSLLIRGYGRRKAIIVGFNDKAKKLYDSIIRNRGLGIDVAAFAAVFEENEGKIYKEIKTGGTYKNLEQLVKLHDAKEVIIAVGHEHNDVIIEVVGKCEGLNLSIKILPDLYSHLFGQAKTAQLYGFPLIDINPQLMAEWEKAAKRLIDIFASLLILTVSLPATLLAAIAIKIDSKGPVFFKQKRSGLNGKPFNMIKFRSMRADAEKMTGPVWSQKNDPRITRVGRFIRKVRIDEIPQMINVLKGEMSLVGPRPERPYFVEKLSKEIPYYKRRLKVRPGITGWAQVKHKYDETIEDVKMKLQYDLFYIENISLRTDIKILFRTVIVVLFGKGHYE